MKIEELFSVRGKVALVTGGSRGIGEMIARGYVENGAKVYISARKADACNALAKELESREKRLDILVNNAGASWGADFDSFPETGWDKVMDLNVKSIFFLT